LDTFGAESVTAAGGGRLDFSRSFWVFGGAPAMWLATPVHTNGAAPADVHSEEPKG
jgi:hypothetical protein